MANADFFLYLFLMAGVTYLIRVIPFVMVKEKIENSFIRSFLNYIPYTVLAVMTVPAVLYATNSFVGGLAGFVAAVVLAFKGESLIKVAVAACVAVFIVELFVV